MNTKINRVDLLGKREIITLNSILQDEEFSKTFNSKIWEIRKKMKISIPKQMVAFFASFFDRALNLSTNQGDFHYPFEKNLLKYFIAYKRSMSKANETEKFKRVAKDLSLLDEQLDKFITNIQLVHSLCNIIFDVLNTEEKYERKQMVNFLTELDGIKNKKMISQDSFELFKQFNDIRNMILHENGLAILIELNIEDMINLMHMVKVIEFSVLSLIRIHCYKIKDSLIGFHENLDQALNNLLTNHSKRCLNTLESNLKPYFDNQENQVTFKNVLNKI